LHGLQSRILLVLCDLACANRAKRKSQTAKQLETLFEHLLKIWNSKTYVTQQLFCLQYLQVKKQPKQVGKMLEI